MTGPLGGGISVFDPPVPGVRVPAVRTASFDIRTSPGRDALIIRYRRHQWLATVSHVPAPPLPPVSAVALNALDALDGMDDSDREVLSRHLQFGGGQITLLDMQGIESFLFGRAKLFADSTSRAVLVGLGLVGEDATYLRIGAAGAPPLSDHPGGEVVEHAYLSGPGLAGTDHAVCGHLPSVTAASLRTSLADGEGCARDQRSIYAHTAYLPRQMRGAAPDGRGTGCERMVLVPQAPAGGLDLMPWVSAQAQAVGLTAYSIRIFLRAGATTAASAVRAPRVTGRVLRRLPSRPLKRVQQATDIASERTFELRPGQGLVAFGTHHPRREPLWEAFRDGRPYEPTGHVHLRITGGNQRDQHAVCHLRSLVLKPGSPCVVLLDPADRVVRVDPVLLRDGAAVSRASGRALKTGIELGGWLRASA